MDTPRASTDRTSLSMTRCHHGWPFTFLVRNRRKTTIASLAISIWNLAEGVVECSWWRLAGDFLIGLLLLLRRRARRSNDGGDAAAASSCA